MKITWIQALLRGVATEAEDDALYVLRPLDGKARSTILRSIELQLHQIDLGRLREDPPARRKALHRLLGAAVILLALDEYDRGGDVIERETVELDKERLG